MKILLLCVKGLNKLYMLRRLKGLGASQSIMKDLYVKQVRPMVEYAVPVWGTSITSKEAQDIERVQKCALSLIFGHQSYPKLLEKSGLTTLSERRENIINKFAYKISKSDQFQSWFKKSQNCVNTRQKSKLFIETPARTNRFLKSPIPVLSRLANKVQ